MDKWIKEKFRSWSEIFLIGNKNELKTERKVSYEEAINFMRKNNIDFYEETSAKDYFNIDKIFKKTISLLYSGYSIYKETNSCSNSYNNSIYDTYNSKN